MKRILIITLAFLVSGAMCLAQDSMSLPAVIHADGGKSHVQGIALDKKKDRMYFSFTTSFVKTDLQGNVLGSIDRIQGHLGAMTFNPKDRKVYASLECKDDVIGAGLSSFAKGRSLFYVAVIDVDKLNSIGMDSENNDIFKIVCVKEAVKDYHSSQILDGEELEHRYGCSGIDGITIAPKIGKIGGRSFLYVAYGIYGDNSRKDNDYQVLLRYDLKKLRKYSRTVRFGDFYDGGPEEPLEKYFIFTGNTTWGVQNMTYDVSSKRMFLAVYKGKKENFRNYDLFSFNIFIKPDKRVLEGAGYDSEIHSVIGSSTEPVQGYRFKWGSTGMSPAGKGVFYISENGKDPESGNQKCDACLYLWTGNPEEPFVRL